MGSRGIVLLFLEHRRLMEVGGQRHALATLPPGKTPVSIIYKVKWKLGSVWTVAENLAPTGIRSPDDPARSESLYRLSCPGPRS
jgi:hypothetical protein